MKYENDYMDYDFGERTKTEDYSHADEIYRQTGQELSPDDIDYLRSDY